MSFGRNDASQPREPHRGEHHFTPQAYDMGAKRIEQGIASGQGTEALHNELNMMREAAMQNGRFNLAQYRADVRAIDAKLHADGYLPHVHIDVDGQGRDVVRRGGSEIPHGGDMASNGPSESPQSGRRHWGGGRNFAPRHGGRHGGGGHGGHGGFHGGRRGHHRRGGGRPVDAGGDNPGSDNGGQPESIAGGDTLGENELRPDNGSNRGGFDRSAGRGDMRGNQQFDRTSAPFGNDAGDARGGSLSGNRSLTPGQQRFGNELSRLTGLDPHVVGAWMAHEQSGRAAQSRDNSHNYNYLNIGYTDRGQRGTRNGYWHESPEQAAAATAAWMKGEMSVEGFGKASGRIQRIANTAGDSPMNQMRAIVTSGWASGAYPSFLKTYANIQRNSDNTRYA